MALILTSDYSKKLGLPGFSSHQFSVSIQTELTDLDRVPGEVARLYQLLQQAVDREIQQTGSMSAAMESELFFLIDDYLEGIAREAWVPSPGQHCAWCDHLDLCRKRSGM